MVKNLASLVYGQGDDNTGYVNTTPRLSYQFFVRIQYWSYSLNEQKNVQEELRSFDSPLVHSIDYPGISVDNITLNSYNIPRTVQTRLRFNPVSFSIYSTQNNLSDEFFTKVLFYNYYNLGGITPPINFLMGPDDKQAGFNWYGYKPASQHYSIPSIKIYRGYLGPENNLEKNDTVDLLELRYNKITAITGSEFNYSSSEPQIITVTVQPQHVEYLLNESKEDN